MEILKREWRSGREIVGIILTRTSIGMLKAYIGVAAGRDQAADELYIAEYGAAIPFREAKAFFPTIEEKDYSTK